MLAALAVAVGWNVWLHARSSPPSAASGGSTAAPGSGGADSAGAGSQTAGGAAGPRRGGQVVFGVLGEPTTLDPLFATDSTAGDIFGLVFNRLLKIDPLTLEPEPDLAASYGVSADGLVYTFHLRPGVTWQDGQPLTAEDVRFTFAAFGNPATGSPRAGDFARVAAVEVVDPLTVRIRLSEVYSPFLRNVAAAYPILPAHRLAGIAAQKLRESGFGRDPLGTGPFRLETWRPGEYVALAANPRYFEGAPYLDRVVFRIIPDQNTLLTQLLSGEIDVDLAVRPQDIAVIERQPNLRLVEFDGLSYTYIGFNLRHPILRERLVRRAIGYAIDRQGIVDHILLGRGRVANGPFPPRSWAYNPNGPDFTYDPEEARRLLDEAGWRPGPDGIRTKDGRPLRFRLSTNQGNRVREQLVAVLQQQLREVGIGVQPETVEWSRFIDDMVQPGRFDAIVLSWSLSADPDNRTIFHSSQFPPGLNSGFYANPTVDRLLDEGARVQSEAERRAIYHQVQAEMFRDPPYIFLYYPKTILALHRRLHTPGEGPRTLADPHLWWVESMGPGKTSSDG